MDYDKINITPPSPAETDQMWKNVIGRIKEQEKIKRRKKIVRSSSFAGIAAILIVVSLINFLGSQKIKVYHAQNNELTIILKDNSKVILAKGATLTLGKSFPSDTRHVFLQGDAVFEVSKSKIHPFIVHAGSYQTKVLGTVFKITQHAATFKVDLYEGKVQVVKTEKPTEAFVIHPKETFSNLGSNDIMTIAPTKSANNLQTDNRITVSFMDLSLLDVVKMLELTYGIKIRYPAKIAGLKISATKKHATAEDMLRLVALQLNLKTNKINDKVFELED